VGLQELHISIGEQVRTLGSGNAALGARWEAANRLDIIATLSDRDDTPNEIVVVTKIKGGRTKSQSRKEANTGKCSFPCSCELPYLVERIVRSMLGTVSWIRMVYLRVRREMEGVDPYRNCSIVHFSLQRSVTRDFIHLIMGLGPENIP
jgi:hypothetical protein